MFAYSVNKSDLSFLKNSLCLKNDWYIFICSIHHLHVPIFYHEWFKLKFNEYLDNLKFKLSQKCIAIDYHPRTGTFIQTCSKYTYKQYCDMHAYLRRIPCEMYHYLFDYRLTNIPMNVKAEVELNARLQRLPTIFNKN